MGHGTHTSTVCIHGLGRHSPDVIASNLHSPGTALTVVLLWAQPKHTVPYQPADNQQINFSAVICTLLLLTSSDSELYRGLNDPSV